MFSSASAPYLPGTDATMIPMGASDPDNPSASPLPEGGDAPLAAREGSYTYELLPSLPAAPENVLLSPAPAADVKISWGQTVLLVRQLCGAEAFSVGSGEGEGAQHVDYHIPYSKLGRHHVRLVSAGLSGDWAVTIPEGAEAIFERPGEASKTLSEAVRSGWAEPLHQGEPGYRALLARGAKVTIGLDDLTFEVTAGRAARATAGASWVNQRTLVYAAFSALLHLGGLGLSAAIISPTNGTDDEVVAGIGAQQYALLERYLAAADEREKRLLEEAAQEAGEPIDPNSTRTRCEEGTMGNPNRDYYDGIFERPGPAYDCARAAALRDAAEFAVITLRTAGPGEWVTPFKQEEPPWYDSLSSRCDFWGQVPGWEHAGELGLSGVGEGGYGALAEGGDPLQLRSLRIDDNPYRGHRFTGSPDPFSPRLLRGRVQLGALSVNGRLAPAVILREARKNLSRFRFCYQHGLANNPELTGRVAVRLVVGTDGSVSNVANAGSDMPDSGVVSCVVRSFYGTTFPRPESGVVTAIIPVLFNPG